MDNYGVNLYWGHLHMNWSRDLSWSRDFDFSTIPPAALKTAVKFGFRPLEESLRPNQTTNMFVLAHSLSTLTTLRDNVLQLVGASVFMGGHHA